MWKYSKICISWKSMLKAKKIVIKAWENRESVLKLRNYDEVCKKNKLIRESIWKGDKSGESVIKGVKVCLMLKKVRESV